MNAAARELRLVLVANARMPSQRAQSLQVAQAAAAFARAGAQTTLLYADRRDTPPLPVGVDLWQYYSVPDGPQPEPVCVPCSDWIDRMPRAFQYVPARLQEITFARNAAGRVRRDFSGATVLTREIETAHALRGRAAVFLEIHRVPGGRTRRRWFREASESAAGVVAISEGVAADVTELGVPAEKLLVAHDAYEPSRFADLPDKTEARRQLDLATERRLVVYTGGLLEWKGVDLVLDAARELEGVSFVIAGGMDADVARLRKAAAELGNVRVDGFQPPARVPLYLAAADVGLVPNRSQPAISARYTSPLKVFEAMAVGLPLVVSDLPSLREVLDETEAVFVTPDDGHALAAGVRQLLDDSNQRERMGARLRERSVDHTWDARARHVLAWMGERA